MLISKNELSERKECHKSIISFTDYDSGGVCVRISCLTHDWTVDIPFEGNNSWLEADAIYEQHACEQLAPLISGWFPNELPTEPDLFDDREV